MTSVIASAAQAAHSVAASLLAQSQIRPGAVIPAAEVKEDSPETATPLTLTGKNVIVCTRYHDIIERAPIGWKKRLHVAIRRRNPP